MKMKDFILIKIEQWSRFFIVVLLSIQLAEIYNKIPKWSYYVIMFFLCMWLLLPSIKILSNVRWLKSPSVNNKE